MHIIFVIIKKRTGVIRVTYVNFLAASTDDEGKENSDKTKHRNGKNAENSPDIGSGKSHRAK